MRIANNAGRLVLIDGENLLDVERASGGTFQTDPMAVFSRWAEFSAWAATVDIVNHAEAFALAGANLDAPSPRPRQVFGIGLNYADHAAESGLPLPEKPVVFTKFSSSVAGPDVEVPLPGDTVDWEAELVVVIATGGRHIPVDEAPSHIAGYTVGQDLSERTVQWQDQPPQFSIGKSFENFAPTGPSIVTLDELPHADALAISATIVTIDGEELVMQNGNTDQLVFSVDELISRLSDAVELLPGDLIFTGTPPGVGAGRDPKRFLVAGERLVTEIEGIGKITQHFVNRLA
ncbi:fumarylacetoacetate hydrolase family protein [Cryobacterium sp. GrIS_2_6]|uniref:fumarylacetoacetate hydrolase family protein n=1 Tax=Cryobacterium sp. GrIS_2_6 TaxID=3162785 RepID=UPI002DF7F81A|nr:2-keto-4-pentenoate hydratase/2-oxohepta-3-ene-1,7-dioic acid hydratase in catechol pathway [Cryobacterium psychrotolerans]